MPLVTGDEGILRWKPVGPGGEEGSEARGSSWVLNAAQAEDATLALRLWTRLEGLRENQGQEY